MSLKFYPMKLVKDVKESRKEAKDGELYLGRIRKNNE